MKRSLKNLKQIVARAKKHEIYLLSYSLAYTTALALAPLFILLVAALSFLQFNSQESQVVQVEGLLGAQAGRIVEIIIENAKKEAHFRGLWGFVSFVILIFSASEIFSQLRGALDKMTDYSSKTRVSGLWAFARDRIFSVGLVFAFIILLVLSISITAALASVFQGAAGPIWIIFSALANVVVFSGLFAGIFHIVPSKKLTWRQAFPAGITGAAFFLIGKWLIGLYLGRSAIGSAYGAAGSLVVFLIWVYYTSYTLLLSFEVSSTLFFDDRKA